MIIEIQTFESQGRNSSINSDTIYFCEKCQKDELVKKIMELIEAGPSDIRFHYRKIKDSDQDASTIEKAFLG